MATPTPVATRPAAPTGGADLGEGALSAEFDRDRIPPGDGMGIGRAYRQRVGMYRNLFGPSVRFDRSTRALMVRATTIGAIMVPPLLGLEARKALPQRRPPVYIVGIAGRVRWVFLTAAPSAHDAGLDRKLRRVPATVAGVGAELALPTPGESRRLWLCQPDEDTELPSYAEVVAALADRGRP